MSDDLDFSTRHSVFGKRLLGSGRLERAAWVSERIPARDLYLLQDGDFSRLLIHEVLDCFVNGQFIATTMLGFSFIERSIAGRLSHNGEVKSASATSKELLTQAARKGWLTESQLESLDDLRLFRNAVTHFKDPSDNSRPEIHAILTAKTTPEFLEQGARRVVDAAIAVLNETAL